MLWCKLFVQPGYYMIISWYLLVTHWSIAAMETTGTMSIGSCEEYIFYSNIPVDIAISFRFSVDIFVYTIRSSCGDVVIAMVHQQKIIPSEWTQSFRAVRDIPVAAYSMPGVNTRRRVAYYHRIAGSLILLPLSISYFKRTLWCWRPAVTIRRNEFIGHALASGLQCNGWCCKNLSSHSFYPRVKCNLLLTNYTHHSKSPDLCG